MTDWEHKANTTLVIGAGELGMAMLKALCEHASPHGLGHAPTVLLRPIEKGGTTRVSDRPAPVLQEMGVKIVRVDLAADAEEGLAAIFAEFSTVICCEGFVGGAGTQRKITWAVLSAGVERYVPWQFGIDYDVVGRGSGQEVFDEQVDVREMLRRQSKTRWIIVSTGMFTSFLFEPAFRVVDRELSRVHALGSWENRLTVTTPDDIGRVTTAIPAHQPRLDNQVVYLAGDTFSYAELADMVECHTGRTVERVLWDMDTLRCAAAGRAADVMSRYHLAFARQTGVALDKDSSFNQIRGIEVTDVAMWLERQKGTVK